MPRVAALGRGGRDREAGAEGEDGEKENRAAAGVEEMDRKGGKGKARRKKKERGRASSGG